MRAEFSYAHFEWLFIVDTNHCTVKSRNIMQSGARKKKLHFLSIGLYGASMHDVEIPAQ